MIVLDELLNKMATFVPSFMLTPCEHGGSVKEDAKPVVGEITYVNRRNGWFMVSYKTDQAVLRECFSVWSIGSEVMVDG